MRYWRMPLIIIGLFIFSACNLGNSSAPPTDEPIATDNSPTTEKPLIAITSPDSGASFGINEEILVSVNASDSVGVTTVRLLANNVTVKTVSSPQAAGETTMSTVLNYTPRAQGTVTLSVIAFRGSIASDPVVIDVVVEDPLFTQPTATTNDTGSQPPPIPNDGVCRVLTKVNLNYRNAPSTDTDNVIRVLPSNTLAPVVARLGNNSWWKLNVNGQRGWVSGNAAFVTLSGNCQNVPEEIQATATPITSATPTSPPPPTATNVPPATSTPGTPDLVASQFNGEQNVVIPSGQSSVTSPYAVIITNTGSGPTGQFSTEINFNGDTIDLGVISNLNANESIVLNTAITFDAVGSFTLRVLPDADNEVQEQSEINNQGTLQVTVTAA